jgi:hypothetical protein
MVAANLAVAGVGVLRLEKISVLGHGSALGEVDAGGGDEKEEERERQIRRAPFLDADDLCVI